MHVKSRFEARRGAILDVIARNANTASRPRAGSIQRRLPSLAHRLIHGVLVVLGALVAVAVGGLAQRLVFYAPRSRSAWTIRAAARGLDLAFVIDTRPPGGPSPGTAVFVIAAPSGHHIRLRPGAPEATLGDDGRSGTWVRFPGPGHDRGTYRVRVYAGDPPHELARARLEVY